MIQTLTRNWLLLTLCGVLDAIIAAVYLVLWSTNGPVIFHSWNGTIVLLGELALAAAVCTISAGIWRSGKGKYWLLVLNGCSLAGLGLICFGATHFRIRFLTVTGVVVLMAMSVGLLESDIARTLQRQRHIADGWFLGVAGAASVGFALAFFALGIRWIKVEPGSHSDLLWLGSYFAFSAICKLGLALRLHNLGPSQSAMWNSLPGLGNPKHAH